MHSRSDRFLLHTERAKLKLKFKYTCGTFSNLDGIPPSNLRQTGYSIIFHDYVAILLLTSPKFQEFYVCGKEIYSQF